MLLLTWGCVHRSYACEEVSCQTVAACCGCRVWSVAGYHVVDGGHVDGVLRGISVDYFALSRKRKQHKYLRWQSQQDMRKS